jgi:hypothetical protein
VQRRTTVAWNAVPVRVYRVNRGGTRFSVWYRRPKASSRWKRRSIAKARSTSGFGPGCDCALIVISPAFAACVASVPCGLCEERRSSAFPSLPSASWRATRRR